MTQAELDALPDVSPGWGAREEIRNGKFVRIPVLMGGYQGALYHGEYDPICVVDAQGERWMIGRIVENGVAGRLVKRRHIGPL